MDIRRTGSRRRLLATCDTESLIGLDAAGLDLRSANFDGDTLVGADFSDALLDHASFKGANLTGASFVGAQLLGTLFHNATLVGARFDRANCAYTFFPEADLLGASFVGMRFNTDTFWTYEMRGATGPIYGTDLETKVVSKCRACNTTLTQKRLQRSPIVTEDIVEQHGLQFTTHFNVPCIPCPGCGFSIEIGKSIAATGRTGRVNRGLGLDFDVLARPLDPGDWLGTGPLKTGETRPIHVAVAGQEYPWIGRLVFPDLEAEERSREGGYTFRRRDPPGDLLSIDGPSPKGASLAGAILDAVDICNEDLSGCDLRGASLRNADLRSTILSGARLGGADLRGADLSGAALDGADLEGARFDELTKWLGAIDPISRGAFSARPTLQMEPIPPRYGCFTRMGWTTFALVVSAVVLFLVWKQISR